MAKQVFDSPDLLRIIYSFGDPEHRKFTKSLKADLESQAKNWYEYFQKNRNTYNSIYSYFIKHSQHEIEEQLSTYKRCFCCTRHSINMPILSNKKVMITCQSVFENHPACYPPETCRCPCRSLSRNFISHLTENYRDYRYVMY
jgi:hypothetical protein